MDTTKLSLFKKIDNTIALLEQNYEEYQSIRKELKYSFLSIVDRNLAIDITSRIKGSESLKEKIIRNQFYLHYDTPEEMLLNLHDLIGLKIDCRFIDEEFKIYKQIKEYFIIQKEDGYSTCERFPHIALNLVPHQPQSQRNGFAIYRIDGYFLNGDHKVTFELQIKSLVNSFWGDIEHKLVYKNKNYIAYDSFMKDMLSTIKANFTVVDRQLHILHDSMDSENNVSSNFLSRISFEELISKAINDLCTEKLRKSLGFTIDIRDTSIILAHYIYKKNVCSVSDDEQISGLLSLFSHLHDEDIDFEHEIIISPCSLTQNPFFETMGTYLLQTMNIDYEWFVFFRILFAIEPGNNKEDFLLFLSVLKNYVIDEVSLQKRFSKLSLKEAEIVRGECLKIFAEALISIHSIKIVHNDKIGKINACFSNYLDELETRVISEKDFMYYRESYKDELLLKTKEIFK